MPAETHHLQPGLLGLGKGLADLLVEPTPGHVVSIRHLEAVFGEDFCGQVLGGLGALEVDEDG